MFVALALLAAVPLAVRLHRRGLAFHWWALPIGLVLHAWMWSGGAREPLFLAVLALFLAAVAGELAEGIGRRARTAPAAGGRAPFAALPPPSRDAIRRVGVSPASSASEALRERTIPRPPRAVLELREASEGEPTLDAGRAIARDLPPAPPDGGATGPRRAVAGAELGAPRGGAVVLTCEHAPSVPEHAIVPRNETQAPSRAPATSPVDPRSVPPREAGLAALAAYASHAQRAFLWRQVTSESEAHADLRDEPARAERAEGRFGALRTAGLRVTFGPVTVRSGTTLLLLACEGPEVRNALAVVPVELEGVKLLGPERGPGGEPMHGRERLIGRRVFVPLHLVVGEALGLVR